MKTALLRRLKRLEEVRVVETQAPLELQISYLKRLPQEYTGERHVVTVGRAADGKYRWEERPGAPPPNEDSPKSIFRIFLVRAKDGRPDYSWPEGCAAMTSVEREAARVSEPATVKTATDMWT